MIAVLLCVVWAFAVSVKELLIYLVGIAKALSGAMKFAFTSWTFVLKYKSSIES